MSNTNSQKRENQAKLSFYIEQAGKEDFEQWCDRHGLDMSTVLRGWIANKEAIGVWIKNQGYQQ
ncbi:hypothetical protein NIES2135_53530 [Leptolyngbya boryana NIES-2135]|jgi:hypothetical protein|uniref:Uncharacterized protein n=1 Tax=Leptolyngbya boryana NIES-2135 TaxID=1973484 RepID=A0A1Z4JP48_LEPBY|nr:MULTISPECIES: hypothetical protein [Leptolyngbya]BAY58480.1 hypothetical protein NIES2135_53530 [Leptolyngbya boryana NIES-2135]MBD2370954.1 hypothetical protein [Leptolyngbya sp. FACHB-161]MBD2377468.1 hypothetical protein [Leptolyngbya sp. FACHB-238]MBD2401876.1 hypothetical protein [Leptolyngbya sp. FACHB-239]MBD2408394.1 hypothetical protein [Leptolyngbya sp. FACHB-402]